MPVFDPMDHETPADDLKALDRLASQAFSAWTEENFQVLRTSGTMPPCEAVEIGTWAGRTALVLAEHFDHVYCVDHWQGNPGDRLGQLARSITPERAFKTFCYNMGGLLYQKVIPCRGPSSLYADIWPYMAALVFIDGDHEYTSVVEDISNWTRHIIPGGILCGHDYGIFEGVTRAVDELIPKSELHLEGHCLWWTTAR